MRIYVYVLKHDSGFAPNPFHGWCTLACCKPTIRRKARPGDWVVGITPRDLHNRVAYAMKVDESLTFEEYWSDRRFKAKAYFEGPPLEPLPEDFADNADYALLRGKKLVAAIHRKTGVVAGIWGPPDRRLVLSHEHTAVRWMGYEDAHRLAHFDGNKTALWELDRRLRGLGPRDEAGVSTAPLHE